MAKEEKDIVFRRVRGRIVPIKVNKSRMSRKRPSHKNKATGRETIKFSTAATILGGAVSSLFGGSAFAEFDSEARRAKDVSKFQFKQAQRLKQDPRAFKGQAKSFSRAAARSRARSARLFKQRNYIASSALALGAFAFAKGLRETGETIKDERLSLAEESILDLGSGAALTIGSIEAGKKLRVPSKKAARLITKALGKRFGF